MATLERDLSDLMAVLNAEADDVADVDRFVRQHTQLSQLASGSTTAKFAMQGRTARRALWPALASAAVIVVIAAGVAVGTLSTGGHHGHATATVSPMRGGIIGASQAKHLPGSSSVKPLTPAVTVTGSGTQSIALGQPPHTANHIEMQLVCLTAGSFTFPDGASVTCSSQNLGTAGAHASYSLQLRPGQASTNITTGPGERWRLTAFYADVTITAWAINTHGQTYGVANLNGTPDLIAALASNGKSGYVYANQINAAPPKTPSQAVSQQANPKRREQTLPVYAKDGQTQLGSFVVDHQQHPSKQPTPR